MPGDATHNTMKKMFAAQRVALTALVLFQLLDTTVSAFGTENTGRKLLAGHVPAVVKRLTPTGRLPAEKQLRLAIGLALRSREELNIFLAQVQDPRSSNYHKYLTSAEFTARFGPTRAQYQAVLDFARQNGFRVTGTHPNRLVVDVEAKVADIERTFQIALRTYRHPTKARDFYAPAAEPSVPANLPVIDVEGLSDIAPPRPLVHPAGRPGSKPLSGSGPSGYYAGRDFRNAYIPGTTLTGAGQAVGLLEFSSYYGVDITNYETTVGMTNFVPLANVVVGHPSPSTANNIEVALDIEVAIAMAPGLSKVIVYETASSPSSILSKMANDNLAKQLSSSWSWGGGPSATIDNLFLQMAAQGQSFFQASGDSDAYTGANALDNSSQATAPVDSTNVTSVGGTTLFMNGSGNSYASETVWNWNVYGGADANVGSGGGISSYYTIPWWQTNVSMAANSGSTIWRNIPDVALTADNVYVAYNNGSSGGVGGTSCAAPLWAGFCALVNQSATSSGGATVGFLNPALYALAGTTNYTVCFHDTTTGNNIGSNVPGLFNAAAGFDLCTGLGTPNGTNLINALLPAPHIVSQPLSQNAMSGNTVQFSVIAIGQSPLQYQWMLDGANLASGGNISGTTSNVLTVSSVTLADAGNYSVVVTNSLGSATSSVAVLNVGAPPVVTLQPTNTTVWAGGDASFFADASGSAPLAFQWRCNGTNLVNGTAISGATSNVLTLAAVTASNAGAYSLAVTNLYGAAASSSATLTVVAPPAIVAGPTNITVQCGSNLFTFVVLASGTSPLAYQWSLDGNAVAGATTTAFSLVNLHLPNHVVAVTVTNLYGTVSSNALVSVHDTLGPVITLNGANPLYLELGSTFADPGATASDLCMGSEPVTVSGSVDANAVGTNTLTYTANDGNGNTTTATRSVIVQDTTPPVIQWSFTNLVLSSDTNCGAALPDLTGTNYILATDLSGSLTITQDPTNGTELPLGTNGVVLKATDSSGNAAYSTNTVVVQDQTPPRVWEQPLSQTANAGANVSFNVGASACTLLGCQWFFNTAILSGQTNSTLSLTNISPFSAGDYFAVLSSSGGSSTSAVAVLTVATPLTVSISNALNQTVWLQMAGNPGATFILQATANPGLPTGWFSLVTNTLDTNGLSLFQDSTATNSQRFYRLQSP
jgi:Pro-kumamolisin, activation domain/Bacterial surface protein, Ig-like domain/Immunoglobulin I-set domain/Immunoglobulin domain